MFDDRVGQMVGQFILLKKTTENQIGAYFRAQSVDLAREVTILLVNPDLAASDDFPRQRELWIDTASRLESPGFVKLIDTGKTTDPTPFFYFVIEWLPGDSLAEILGKLKTKGSWVTLGEATRLVSALALTQEAIVTASPGAQVDLYRFDPQLIRFRAQPEERLPYTPVIDDPGLDNLSGKKPAAGSRTPPAYLSPEEAQQQPATAPSLVYSLGILLFELVTGQLPFPVTSLAEAARYHPRQPLPPPASLHPDLPQPLEAIILRALQKKAADRYASPGEMAAEIQKVLPDLEGLVAPPPVFEHAESLVVAYLASLGAYRAYAERIPATQPTTAGVKPTSSLDKVIDISLEQTNLAVEPGRTAAVTVAVHNPSDTDKNVMLSVEGLPANWVTLSPRDLALQGNEQKIAQIILKPPRLSTTRAGRYPFKVKAVEKQKLLQPGEASAVLAVGVYNQFRGELKTPQVSTDETAQVIITNAGNVPDTYTIAPKDLENVLVYDPPQSVVRLGPGQIGQADFKPALRTARLIGGPRSHPYSADVIAASGGKQSPPGEFISRSILPAWVPLLLLGLCLCSGIVAMIYVGSTLLGQTADQRKSIALTTNTAAAMQSTVLAITQTSDALVNANQSTLQSVTRTAEAGVIQTATAQIATTGTAQAVTATASAAAATAQANATYAYQFTATAAALATQQAGIQFTATSVSRTATAQTGQFLTATALAAFYQTATAQTSLIRTATAQAGLIQTATAQAKGLLTATSVAATATAQANKTPIVPPSPTPPAPPQQRLAYIYLTSSSLGREYQEFLKLYNYSLDLIPMDAIPSIDFGVYIGLLVAPETGENGLWGDPDGNWKNKIVNSGLPVIGLGEGGFNFFGTIPLQIGWPNGIDTSTNQILALNTGSDVWKKPYLVQIPSNGIVTIYNSSIPAIASTVASPLPAEVVAFGQWPDFVNQFPVVWENERYLLWGFSETPRSLTANGQALFLNLLKALTT